MFEEQLAAFEKFSKLKVGALFMEMGTGKTRVALELVNYNDIELLLYFTPFSTINNINQEIEKWGVDCDYRVIGFESISSSDALYLDILDLVANKKVFIIADESIFIKNAETKRYERLLKIRESCDYALILNGTPISKNEWDIYYQFRFLSYKIFNMSQQEFQSTFFDKVRYKKRYEKPHEFYKFSEVNAAAFQKIIDPYVFKSELDIDINETVKEILVDADLEEYQQAKKNWLSRMTDYASFEDVMSMLTSLNVIISNSEEKLDELSEYINNKQVVVYCNYLEEVTKISSKVDCYTITGATNIRDRQITIDKFKRGDKPLIMTYGVGAYSLNLQFCNEIVFSSLNFDYSKIEQSKYRIKRIGQERDIKYTYFIVKCGLTDMIMTNLEQKRTMANLIKEKINDGNINTVIKNL